MTNDDPIGQRDDAAKHTQDSKTVHSRLWEGCRHAKIFSARGWKGAGHPECAGWRHSENETRTEITIGDIALVSDADKNTASLERAFAVGYVCANSLKCVSDAVVPRRGGSAPYARCCCAGLGALRYDAA